MIQREGWDRKGFNMIVSTIKEFKYVNFKVK